MMEMIKNRLIHSIVGMSVCIFLMSGAHAATVTIDYHLMGSFSTSVLDVDGVTVTGPRDINVLNLNGLGIIGGGSDALVDTDEYLDFSFNAGGATNVSYILKVCSDTNSDGIACERTLEAFDTSGVSLGSMFVSGLDHQGIPVTALYGDVAISRFRLTMPGHDTLRFRSLTFTSAVPIPAAVWLFGSGLLGLLGLAKSKTRA